MMVREKMTVEQMDHFLRHVKMHADELRNGTFSKDITYLEKLREAQRMAIDISHEMFHIMRRKGFENYAGQDFVFNVAIPEDLEHYEFHMFDYESFRLGCKIQRITEILMDDEIKISLEPKPAADELERFSNAIQDAAVMIKMVEKHFSSK